MIGASRAVEGSRCAKPAAFRYIPPQGWAEPGSIPQPGRIAGRKPVRPRSFASLTPPRPRRALA